MLDADQKTRIRWPHSLKLAPARERPAGSVVSDQRSHAASKFDPEGAPVAIGALGACSSAIISLQCVGATDCRGEADHRGADVWGKAKVPVKVTINDYTLRSTVDNRAVQRYIVVNADARWNAAVKVADVIPIFAGENDDTATGCGNG